MTPQLLLAFTLLHPTLGSAEGIEIKPVKESIKAVASMAVAKPNKPGPSSWRHEDTLHFEAEGDDNIRSLFQSLGELDDLDPRLYEKAEVTVYLYRWIGETTCAPHDLRLRRESLTYNLQGKVETDENGGHSANASMSMSSKVFPEQDPCL